ncbi:MAG: hypothetical protein KGP29_01520 [Proteobacteria bacterium]|nr:hypothetical protein [Pseudomonadota bacterium]
MKKKLILTFLILILLLSAYSGFWFFEARQVEKELRNLSTYQGQSVSMGEVKVSGFPFSKEIRIKDLKISQPEDGSLGFKELVVKNVSGANDFEMNAVGAITFNNGEGKGLIIEFDPESKVGVTVKQGKVAQVKWSGTGYKINSEQTNAAISTLSSKSLESEIAFGEHLTYKVKATDVKITNAENADLFSADLISLNLECPNELTEGGVIKFDLTLKEFLTLKALKNLVPSQLAENKKNFLVSGEFSFADNAAVAEKNHLLSKDITFTLKNLEFSETNFKISASGSIKKSAVENLPSGEFNLLIENIDYLLGIIADSTHQENKFLSNAEIIKQLGSVNPTSKDKVLAFNLRLDKSTNSEIQVNDVSQKAVARTANEIAMQARMDQLDAEIAQEKNKLKKKKLTQAKQQSFSQLPPKFDSSKIDLTTLNSAHVDVSKVDQSLGQEKINQFYQILSNQKNINTEATAAPQTPATIETEVKK